MGIKNLFSFALLAAAWLAGGMAWAQSEPAQDSDGWYLLGTVDDVEWFGQQVMDGKHATIKGKLTADIDYEGVVNRHRPIGHYGQKFVGKFDGQGHRILNMVLNDPTLPKGNDDGTGFFGCVRVGGDGFIMGSDTEKETNDLVEIKNLIIDASCKITSSRANTAGLVGRISEKTTNNTVLIENCINEATIVTTANAPAGIVGQINNAADGNVIIRNCVNKGTVTTSGLAAAGIISQVYNCAVKLNIESCMNLADVKSTGNKNCGGIHGANTSSNGIIKIINCGNTGNVTGTDESAALTGWIGSKSGNVITNCWNSGTVTGVKGTDNTYRGTVSVNNIYDIKGGQGTPITSDNITSGKLCYLLNGNQSTINWWQKLNEDGYPLPFEKVGAIVYEVGDFNCDGTPKGTIVYSNTAGGSQDPHTFENGICSVCGATDDTYVTLNADGYYYLSNAYEVEWFSAKVKEAKNAQIKAKLDADIDFTGIEHTPIGPTSGAKFFGEFDGQGHTISNLTMDSDDNAGFFLWVRGGSTIKNLIMDSSCSFHAVNRCAAFVCVIQAAAGGAINIKNCINKAAVSSENLVSSAFVASCNWENTDQPAVNITNCCNTGNITHNGTDCAAAIFGWNKGTCTIKGCYNTGTVSPLDSDKRNLVRSESGKTASIIDTYDLSATPEKTQGVKTDWTTENPITSGELCYFLNGDQSEIGWRQTIGTDTEPKLFGSSQQVYVQGYVDCTSTPVGDFTYSNTGGTIQLDHNINADKGMCDVCHTQFQAPSLVDGYYELRNAGNVEWYSQYVSTAGGNHSGAKLMNDIDFLGIENLHSPIGPNEENKFNATFDGQGFRIKNMIINRPSDNNIGFFGWLRGNNAPTTVKNLIIDASCSIHANNRVGGITGTYQNGGSVITIENVINEAKISANGQDAGGIFGGHDKGGPTIIIKDVLNTGSVTSTHADAYVGALCCYMEVGGGSKIENFVNLGTIGTHKGGNIGRHNIGDVTNLIDLSDTDNKTQGTDSGLTIDDIANGKLAYTVGWGQLLDTDAYPTPLNETKVNYVGDAGYATMYDTTSGYKLNGNAKAYTATANGNYLRLNEIADIPAGTAVVLKGSYYNLLPTTATSSVVDNDLQGTDTDITADGTMYVLAKPDGKVGFYIAEQGSTIAAGKAYYQSTAGVKAFYFDGGDATGITNVENAVQNNAIYNIAGQRIQKLQKGINIINGQKILY